MLGLAHRGKTATIKGMKPKESLAERFKLAVARLGVSLQSLEKTPSNPEGLPRGYPSMIARGERKKLSPDMLARSAQALRVRIEWLATGQGPMELQTDSGFPRVLNFEDDAHYAALVRGHARRMGISDEVAERAIQMAARDGKVEPEQIPSLLTVILHLTPDSGDASHPLLDHPKTKALPPHRD